MGDSKNQNSPSNVDPRDFSWFFFNGESLFSPSEILVVSEDRRTRVYIPMHRGGSFVQVPEAKHSSLLGPFSSYPSAQWKLHSELKEKFPRGWLQFMCTC